MKAQDVEDVYELSPLQHGMLFENLYAPAEGTYIEQSVLTIDGMLDRDAFWRAWQNVVDRHPALRTTFHWDDIKKPVQMVHRSVTLPRDEVDWRDLTETERAGQLREYLRGLRSRGFDAAARPPMAVRLCLVSAKQQLIALSFHHLILDGWSVGIVLSEFMSGYAALSQGRPAELSAAGKFRDYVAWWRGRQTDELERHWRDRLAGFQAPPALDLGPPPPNGQNGIPYEWSQLDLDDMAGDVRSFARTHRMTPHTLVQGAWTLVLSAYLRAEDVMVGTTFAHRPASVPRSESIVGCMVATVPVRTPVQPSLKVLDYLHAVQDSIMSARDHCGADLVEMHSWSPVPRSARLFESIVTYQNIPLPDFSFPGADLSLRSYTVDTRPQVPLVLMVLPGDGLPLRLVHDMRRFGSRQAGLMLARVRQALLAMMSAPDAPLAELDICPGSERRLAEEAGRDPRNAALLAEQGGRVSAVLRETAGPVTIRVVDAHGRDVPLGAAGLLGVAGPHGELRVCGERGRFGENGTVAWLGRAADPADPAAGTAAAGTAGPGTAGPGTAGPGTADTDTERAIADMMAEILDLDEVGAEENLIELGLHSLLGTRVVSQLRDLWKVSVPLRAVFENPTVAGLAQVVEAGGTQASAGESLGELSADVVLGESVHGTGAAAWQPAPSRLLVTGATGYLGSFLVAQLLRTTAASVTCLVRDADPEEGTRRVTHALRTAGLWEDGFAGRLDARAGNLSQPDLGLPEGGFAALAAEVDEIYHMGAVVNILPAYRRIRPVNVGGTHEILRLAATGRTKPVHYISPAELTEHPDPGRAGRELPLGAEPPDAHNGYIASKWAGERLVSMADARGVPAVVYRAARLVGSVSPMYWKPGDATSEIVQACVHLGLVPESEVCLPASPVDYVARGIAALARRKESLGHQYHLVARAPFSFRTVGEAMTRAGYRIRFTAMDQWYAELVRLSARLRDRRWDLVLAVVGPWKQAAEAGWREPDYHTDRARAALGDDVTCPPVDARYLAGALGHFAERGLIPAPGTPGRR